MMLCHSQTLASPTCIARVSVEIHSTTGGLRSATRVSPSNYGIQYVGWFAIGLPWGAAYQSWNDTNMNPLFTVLFGFVCHPFVMMAAVLTQLGWSMWIYDADLAHPPVGLHAAVGCCAVATIGVVVYMQCRRREAVPYHPEWSKFGGRLFQGQLALGMSWGKQLLMGCALGVLVSLIDESELMVRILLSSTMLDDLRREHGPRGGVPHMSHAHDALLTIFIVHSWAWTLLTAWVLGVWSNAAKLHSAQAVLNVD